MDLFEISRLAVQRTESGKSYLEFLRVPTLTSGLYVLEAGATDAQQPHSEDEVYYIVSGQGFIIVGEEQSPVQTGSIIFVAAKVRHFFHDISEKMSILVFFAPAEYSQAEKL